MRQIHFIASVIVSFAFLALAMPFERPQVWAAQTMEEAGAGAGVAGKQPAHTKALRLNELFDKLKSAKSEAQGRFVEADIWEHWSWSGEENIDRLMKQAKLLASRGLYEPSLGLLDRVIYEKPNFVEGWNRRATVLFFMRRDEDSLAAIAKVLSLEPRHFGALAGKAMINMRGEQWNEALNTLRRTVEIHPWLKERHLIKILEQKLKLQDL